MQKLILEIYPEAFSNKVNKMLEAGWRVVPDTLQANISTVIEDRILNRTYSLAIVLESPMTIDV